MVDVFFGWLVGFDILKLLFYSNIIVILVSSARYYTFMSCDVVLYNNKKTKNNNNNVEPTNPFSPIVIWDLTVHKGTNRIQNHQSHQSFQ